MLKFTVSYIFKPTVVVVSPLVKEANHHKYMKPVVLMEFENYVKDAIETKELERQHKLFPRGNVKPCEYGSMKQNKLKNRYNNLVACKFKIVRHH